MCYTDNHSTLNTKDKQLHFNKRDKKLALPQKTLQTAVRI